MGEELNNLSLEEGTTYYIDGQPFEGIKEVDLELEAHEPEELGDGRVESLKTAASAELSLTLTPESAKAIMETLKPAFDEIDRALKAFGEWAGNVIREVAAAVGPCMNNLVDNMLYATNDHPKWWHYYKHAKKTKTRKKYRRRLIKQLHEKLANGDNLAQ